MSDVVCRSLQYTNRLNYGVSHDLDDLALKYWAKSRVFFGKIWYNTGMGATWLRRGLQNQRCMPRLRLLVNQTQINTNANDEIYAEDESGAIAA